MSLGKYEIKTIDVAAAKRQSSDQLILLIRVNKLCSGVVRAVNILSKNFVKVLKTHTIKHAIDM